MYLWIKALHIIAVISWMVGLLYLPRLFVYHADVGRNSAQAQTFVLMERRLLKAIMTPAMIITFALGFWMLFLNPGLFDESWLHAKILLVFALAGVHVKFAAMRKNLESGENVRSARYYKIWNEVPTVFMIAIVILVVVRPFN
jgi:putative membrane protein